MILLLFQEKLWALKENVVYQSINFKKTAKLLKLIKFLQKLHQYIIFIRMKLSQIIMKRQCH